MSILIGLREGWKFLCNLYGLKHNPFLVIRVIKKRKDWMQFFRLVGVLGLPFLVYALGLPVWVWGQKWMGLNFYRLNKLVEIGGIGVFGVEMLIGMYLFFWVRRVYERNHFIK